MIYSLFKLHFTAPVHFGAGDSAVTLPRSEMTFCADRLFSALCLKAEEGSADGARRLCDLARSGALRLSDAMPFCGRTLYLPRPCMEAAPRRDADPTQRKAMKKVNYIPLPLFGGYLAALHGGEPINPQELTAGFGTHETVIRAAVPDGADTLPYAVGAFCFAQDCGLYLLAAVRDEAPAAALERALKALGHGGIGGKVSSGYGTFTVERAEVPAPLPAWLEAEQAEVWISLTTALPKDDELDAALDGALYRPARRGGFVQSPAAAGGKPQKKREQVFLCAGSCFRSRFAGDVYDAAPAGFPHPVYRYGMPLFLGVTP